MRDMRDFDLVALRKNLYQHHKDFQYFQNLSGDMIYEIEHALSFFTSDFSRLELYTAILKYYKTIGLVSFDAKLYGLISTCDPTLRTLDLFIAYGMPQKGNARYDAYSNAVRNEIGFYDSYILKYENYYRKYIVNGKTTKKVKELKKVIDPKNY